MPEYLAPGVYIEETSFRAKSIEVNLQSDKGKLQVSFGDCMLEVGEEPKKGAPGGPAPQQPAPQGGGQPGGGQPGGQPPKPQGQK